MGALNNAQFTCCPPSGERSRPKHVVVGKIQRPDADDVHVRPPAPPLQQQLVAKEVGKRGQAAFAESPLVAEDFLGGKDLLAAANDRAGGDIVDFIVRVEMEGMTVV